MKNLTSLLFAAVAAASVQAATVDRVIVRQQWPWHTGIKVEYALSGMTGAVDVGVKVYRDGVLVEGIPSTAFVGDVFNVTDDVGSFTIDAAAVFGSDSVRTRNLRVELTLTESEAKMGEVLYKIFDLDTGACTDVTRADLLNGKYGSYETDYSKIGKGYQDKPFTTALDDVLIWTGVTNNIAYKTSKLVMRKIHAKDKVWQSGDPSGAEVTYAMAARTQYWNKFTYDYYIAVFETTLAQYKKIAGSYPTGYVKASGDEDFISAANMIYHYSVVGNQSSEKGKVSPDEIVCFPTNSYVRDVGKSSSVAGKMWDKTGIEFTLPTIAEWEFACEGGNSGVLYSGLASGMTVNKEQLGWVKSNAGGEIHRVGEKPCNAYGLYDMLGNAMERVLGGGSLNEGGESGTGASADDPVVNPLGNPNRDGNTHPTFCGGCWGASDPVQLINDYCSVNSLRHAARHSGYVEWFSTRDYMGFRFVMPARADGQWADHPVK